MTISQSHALRPRVSVVTPAYQASATVGRAVESVIRQGFNDWEMVVVDDGSIDDTGVQAQSAAAGDPRVRIVRQANAGTGAARNRGLDETTGEWVIFLDADDELLPDYMEAQLAFADSHKGSAIIGCNVIMRGQKCDALWTGPEVVEHSLSLEELLTNNTISIMALVSRAALFAVGGLRTVYAEDYDLWIRMLLAGYRHHHQPRILGIYHKMPSSKSGNRRREWVAVARMLRGFRISARLTPQQERLALESENRFIAMYLRVRLEEWILRGDYSRARKCVLATRCSFATTGRFVMAAVLTFAAPALYRRRLTRVPSGYTSFI